MGQAGLGWAELIKQVIIGRSPQQVGAGKPECGFLGKNPQRVSSAALRTVVRLQRENCVPQVQVSPLSLLPVWLASPGFAPSPTKEDKTLHSGSGIQRQSSYPWITTTQFRQIGRCL